MLKVWVSPASGWDAGETHLSYFSLVTMFLGAGQSNNRANQ